MLPSVMKTIAAHARIPTLMNSASSFFLMPL